MITVLHVITGLRRSGAEHCLARLVQRMDQRRFLSRIITILPSGPLAEEIKVAKIEVETLNCTSAIQAPRALWQLGKRIRQLKPDIVQTWLYHADMLGALTLRSGSEHRLAWNIRNSDLALENRLTWHVLTSILALFSRAPDCIIANSQAGIDAHVNAGYRPRRWVHIPNGWSIPDAKCGVISRDELGLPFNDILVGLVARLAKQKDFDSFLSAIALLHDRCPNLKFVLVGAGVTPEALQLKGSFSDAARRRLIFLGEQTNLERIWPALDAVTLTSAYGEGMPNCIGEAMAAGLPVIATDVGDTRRLVTEENWLVPPRSPEALANAWLALADLDPSARRAIGEFNRTRILRHYHIDRMVTEYEELYTRLMQPGLVEDHARNAKERIFDEFELPEI